MGKGYPSEVRGWMAAVRSLRGGRAEGPSEKVSPGGWSPGKGTGFNAEKRRQERPRASAWVGEEGRGPWHARRDAGLGRNTREEKWRNGAAEAERRDGRQGLKFARWGSQLGWSPAEGRAATRGQGAPSPNPELRRRAQRRGGGVSGGGLELREGCEAGAAGARGATTGAPGGEGRGFRAGRPGAGPGRGRT